MACPSKICNPTGAVKPEVWLAQKVRPAVREGMKHTVLDNNMLKKDMQLFLENINRGLKKATHSTAIVKCFPTYVQDLPDGTCVGKFLALDLGGTNFRVLLVTLDGGKCDMQAKVYAIPHELMVGSGVPLFDHIAKCLFEFANEHNVATANLPLGFTFSFPLEQRGLCVGILERWTKGFKCEDVIGQDVVKWLTEAIDRRGDVKIDVCAVLNDTTGTLMSAAWNHKNCLIGLIVGTGNNGCYVETQKNAELFDEPDMGSGKVIINLEMGAFGDDGCLDFIFTDIDKEVDATTVNAGRQLHEKMISGMYLGEIVRKFALRLAQAGAMFGGNVSDTFRKPDSFLTEYLSKIEADPVGVTTTAHEILAKLGIPNASEQDCIDLRYICQCISSRSAHLVAAATATLMHKMGERKVTVAVDGSVYKHHPQFRRVMIEKMHELLQPGYSFDVVLSEDGSGRGAALVAAVAARKKREMEAAGGKRSLKKKWF